MSAVPSLPPDPEQLRELEMLRREYEANMMVSSDPQEQRRLYAVMKQLEACIAEMKKRLDLKHVNERECYSREAEFHS